MFSTSKISLMVSSIFILFVLLAETRADSFDEIGKTTEDVVYDKLGKVLIKSGKSDHYASCFVFILRLQRPFSDYSKISKLVSDRDGFIHKINEKAKFADFMCQYGLGAAIFTLIVIHLIFICLCLGCCYCIKRLCCPSSPRSVSFAESRYRHPNLKSRVNEKVEMSQSPTSNYV